MHPSFLIQSANKRVLFLEKESIHNKLLRIYLAAQLEIMGSCVETVNALLSFISYELFLPWFELHRRLLLQYLL